MPMCKWADNLICTFYFCDMPVNTEGYRLIKDELSINNVTLVAVSKTKPVEDILELYNLGHSDFGENYEIGRASCRERV